MKIRIREGNDFDVAWAIKRAGVPEDLSTAINMKLTLVVYGLVIEHNLFTVTDNVLSINIPKEVATVNGDYRLIFEYTLPDAGQPDGDLKCKTDVVPFRIVPFTAKADDIYTINVTSDIAFGFKGDKGDDGDDAYQIWLDLGNVGTYEDFIAYLRQPAVDAGVSISELEGEIQVSESLRVEAELLRQTNTQEAISNAENATENANTSAQNADDARLAIQDDLELKANQTDLEQLAGEVDLKEVKANKQNSLAVDGTGTKFPTVDAVNAELGLKANKEQEAWITPTLQNGWVNLTNNEIQYFKDDFGFVHLRGTASDGTFTATVFTFPVGYRPARNYEANTSSGIGYNGYITVRSNGVVWFRAGAMNNVNNITFKAEQ